MQAGRPAFCPFGCLGCQFRGHADLRVREDLPGAGRIESQVAGPELQRVAGRAEPGQVRLLVAAGGGQLRPGGIATTTTPSTS